MGVPSVPFFNELLTPPNLRELAGGRSFERGEAYFANGRVGALSNLKDAVRAKVKGARTYRVKLWPEEGRLAYSCSCPVGNDGAFCKHCVAVGLAYHAHEHPERIPSPKPPSAEITMDHLRNYLGQQDKQVLVGFLMERAEEDDRLRERLLMKAAKQNPEGPNLETFRNAIDRAIDTGGFVDYHSAYDYSQGIEEVLDSIADLLKEGYAAEVIELAEHALRGVEEAIHSMDDSDGYMGGILERLQKMHHDACKKARPDPEMLAKRLFEWELRSDWDTFSGAAATYAGVLGPKGLAVYRALAESRWARVPHLKPGDPDRFTDGTRFRLTHMMETLAKESGEVEALVAIKTRDLSHAYAYLQIAEIYRKARKHDQALEWAERGVKAFPQRTDGRLREFLAQEYHHRNRHEDAMALIWAEFKDHSSLENYKGLKAHADKVNEWPVWRERALACVREEIAKAKRASPNVRWAWGAPADHSTLVRIFLWEKNSDEAWREAQAGGCTDDLWLEVARCREEDHPEDAALVYRKQVEPALERKNNEAYREALDHLRKIQNLMTRLGRTTEFNAYLATVRATHKAKRNFVKLIDGAHWA